MGRKTLAFAIEGTIKNVTYYKRKGNYELRLKSSLNREKVLTDPAFERSRMRSMQFIKASKLSSKLYWMLPKGKRKPGVIGKIIGQIQSMMVSETKLEVIIATILEQFGKMSLESARQATEIIKKDHPLLFELFVPPLWDVDMVKFEQALSPAPAPNP